MTTIQILLSIPLRNAEESEVKTRTWTDFFLQLQLSILQMKNMPYHKRANKRSSRRTISTIFATTAVLRMEDKVK